MVYGRALKSKGLRTKPQGPGSGKNEYKNRYKNGHKNIY